MLLKNYVPLFLELICCKFALFIITFFSQKQFLVIDFLYSFGLFLTLVFAYFNHFLPLHS